MQPDETPVTVEDITTEHEGDDSSDDDDDDSWNCADEEIKDELDSEITAIFEVNRDRVTRERFHFILQTLLTDPNFLSED
jgi:hypothetical protein